ncbi:MAG: hypothetical protein ACLSXC_06125 [Beduini sp.]
MKKQLTPYLFSFAFIFIGYLLMALLLVLSELLFKLNNTLYNAILVLSSYVIIIAASFLFIQKIKTKPMIHAIIFSIIYLLISYLAGNGVIHLLHLFLKPIVFIIGCVIFTMFKPE